MSDDSAAIQRLKDGCHTTTYEDAGGEKFTNIQNFKSANGNILSLNSNGDLVAVDSITCDPEATIHIGTENTGGLQELFIRPNLKMQQLANIPAKSFRVNASESVTSAQHAKLMCNRP